RRRRGRRGLLACYVKKLIHGWKSIKNKELTTEASCFTLKVEIQRGVAGQQSRHFEVYSLRLCWQHDLLLARPLP
ncbi:hypothetical protein ABEV55_15710, partial [Aneurinibacillus thermoaerophilus]|uniref:hypothetical protein n=1 Tax=Aneurinibacillus thermoaerophilus TaxID=143495 RepID=UPI002E1AB758|nr:hypothetical protein [Aneurinibacillus thermoaerophilus]